MNFSPLCNKEIFALNKILLERLTTLELLNLPLNTLSVTSAVFIIFLMCIYI